MTSDQAGRNEPVILGCQAARGFLESWLIRKDYDAAFGYLSPRSYGCYDLERNQRESAATSPEDAGRKLRAGLEASGKAIGAQRSLEAVSSIPNALAVQDPQRRRAGAATGVAQGKRGLAHHVVRG